MNQVIENSQRKIIEIKATINESALKTRVASYARVSSSSDDQLHSFTSQVNYYTSLISSNEDWEFVDVYADEGITGVSAEKREDFNRMIADCKKGKIDRILTKSISRFSRNTVDSLKIARELKNIGVSVYFEQEQIDTSKMTSEVMLTLHSVMAEQESITISKNVKKANRMRMEMGTYTLSKAPYGYRLINKELVVHKEESQIVKRIFSDYISGKGVYKIAYELTKENIPTTHNKKRWNGTVISYILKNERYIGDSMFQKSFNQDIIPYKKQINYGELTRYYFPNTHDGIVEKVVFELTKILFSERKKLVNLTRQEYPLSKRLVCGECGTTFRRKVINDITYWGCKLHDENSDYCASSWYTEESIYEAFIEMYNKLNANKNILIEMKKELAKLQDKANQNNVEITTINKKIAELKEQNHVMAGLMSSGILDSALFISGTDKLNGEIIKLKQAKSSILNDDETEVLLSKTEEVLDILEDAPEYITTLDEEILNDLIKKIKIHKGKIMFELINGLILTERIE